MKAEHMMRALKSSLWVHLPGMIAVAAMVALTAARRPWPARAPVHFDMHWNADRWGPPWECAMFPALGIIILVSGITVSAIWAGQEKGKKRFNVTLPLLVAPLGAVTGVHLWYWWNLAELAGAGHAAGAWGWVWICAGIVLAASAILEIFRKPGRQA
jgi:hypothetical protein